MDKVNQEWAKDIPCRNVIIYGYCKKQKEGCPFKHDDNIVENASVTSVNNTNDTTMHNEFDSIPQPQLNVKESTPIFHSQIIGPPNGISLSELPSLTKNNKISNSTKQSNNNNIADSSPPPHTSSPSFTKFNAKMSASFTPMFGGSDNHFENNSNNSNNITLNNNMSNLSIDKHSTIVKKDTPLSFTNNTTTTNSNIDNMNPLGLSSMNQSSILQQNPHHTQLSSSPTFNLPSFPQQHQPQLQQPGTGGFPISSLPLPQGASGIMGATTNPNSVVPPPPPPPNNNTVPLNYPTIYPPPHSILQYHLYFPETPQQLKLSMKPNEKTPDELFISNNLREQLVKKNLASLQNFPPGGPLPDLIQDYFGLVPLDFHEKKTDIDRYQGHKNSLFKVFSNIDGKLYVLRRIHDLKSNTIDSQHLAKTFQNWKKLQNVNIVALKDVFITTKFNDSSLCLIYDYYPKAISLYETHFINFPLLPITQDYLWIYLIQLTNAMKSAHCLDLILGDLINWEKIIVTNRPGLIKLSGIAAHDLLFTSGNKTPIEINKLKQQDYVKLGHLLIKLASNVKPPTNNPLSNNNTTPSSASSDYKTNKIHKDNVEIDQLQVEDSFKEVLRYLTNDQDDNKNVKDLSVLFIDQLYSNFNALKHYDEYLNKTLQTELENSRLFRLLCKMNFIFGRIESRIDINWSESGEKFPIILFYDFVFHQIDETGKPVMDLTHVLRCLNKLDAGVSEKLVLVTPDEMNCIIISYKELKDLIESTFRSLTQTN